jgi:hypothetical protein
MPGDLLQWLETTYHWTGQYELCYHTFRVHQMDQKGQGQMSMYFEKMAPYFQLISLSFSRICFSKIVSIIIITKIIESSFKNHFIKSSIISIKIFPATFRVPSYSRLLLRSECLTTINLLFILLLPENYNQFFVNK